MSNASDVALALSLVVGGYDNVARELWDAAREAAGESTDVHSPGLSTCPGNYRAEIERAKTVLANLSNT